MTRPREGNFKAVMLYLDPDELDKFSANLPKTRSASEVIRQYIHDENERTKKEKKVVASDRSAINTISDMIYIHTSDRSQMTLDIFAKEREIVDYFKELEKTNDVIMIRKFTRNCQLGHDLGRTYFRKAH